MKPRRKPAALRKPDSFSAENVLTGLNAPRLLALGREFEQFHFVHCELAEASLAGLRFEDCLFERCNLTTAKLSNTALQNVAFADCKLLGVAFATCQDMFFGVHFDDCQLRYASFAGKKLAGTRFERCTLPETDFTNADLTNAVFAGCDLTGTIFHDTRLAGTDFTTATGYGLDPEANYLAGARFALACLPGLLAKYGLVVEG
ncbi:pentapeptide repeat-containing protein [Hymenobacter sp. BRD128]|uniref:pentapeptide repeat-containing protein n=1 Tax=Hymenobacter sp. BRD128 TaxID=2675878 RepID=UPI0015648E61|nr:pentapeptide repeat-containing protein [Hymenobacter sp. BRD128]QKG55332.1 pentapeptide repeat-containing protein [Hymenobacter sp. BRD128]